MGWNEKLTGNPMRNAVAILTLLLVAGCGYYSMAGSIPPHIKSIAIPIVRNQTAEFGVAEQITDDLQNRFIEENILKVVDEDQADSILRGTIISVADKVHTFTREEAVEEYRLTIKMDIEWYDVIKDKVLLKKTYTGWGAYGVSGDISTDNIDNDGDGAIDDEDDDEVGEPREFATRVAVNQIAEEILDEIVASW